MQGMLVKDNNNGRAQRFVILLLASMWNRDNDANEKTLNKVGTLLKKAFN